MMDSFKFVGFEPSNSMRTLAKTCFWRMEDNAPSRSAKKGLIKKTDTGFTGEVEFSSVAGHFFVEANAQTPEELLKTLNQELKTQLLEWKKTRFQTA